MVYGNGRFFHRHLLIRCRSGKPSNKNVKFEEVAQKCYPGAITVEDDL
jgi:hypothetical protein